MISLMSLRKRLALPRTSWQICLLAIIGGCASALLVVLFTFTIEQIQQLYLVKRDNYTSLDGLSRFNLPIIGALVILLFAWLTGYQYLRTGIPFILHRLKVAHGIIPLKNTLNQFWGSAIALASGFSIGREGPAVHLGAACSSYIGSQLKLPYNSIRTLCACGIAAGIAATFNTPLAAVIFVMEVILREYKIHVFIPIMLAALTGSLITSHVFSATHNFEFFNHVALHKEQYPVLIILAIALGTLAFLFNRYLVSIIKRSKKFHIVTRLMLAAIITGALGYIVPDAMGTDVGVVDFSLNNHWQINLLLGLLAAKFLMTIFALGLGIPGGIIGPILGLGAIAGTCSAAIATHLTTGEYLASDFALMGMAGFMAATLNAPLAALLAVVELSNQIEIIVPAMIVITISSLISGQFFKNRSIFTMQLDVQGLIYRKPPIEESLQKIGVLGIMKTHYALIEDDDPRTVSGELACLDISVPLVIKKHQSTFNYYLAEFKPDVIGLEQNDVGIPNKKTIQAIPTLTTANDSLPPIIQSVENAEVLTPDPVLPNDTNTQEKANMRESENVNEDTQQTVIHSKDQIIEHQLLPFSHQATLAEAYLALVEKRCGGVYIYQDNTDDIIGIIKFEQIRHYLVEGKFI